MDEAFQQILTDAARDIDRRNWHLDSSALPDYDGPPWSINKFELRGGQQQGVQLVEIDNGAMSLTIIPTRGMNVLEARTDRARYGWDSPVKEIVHPTHIRPSARGGLGWLAGFNELVARCGLENTGAPGPDTIVDNQGNRSTIELPLHGRISNIPASRLWVRVTAGDAPRVVVGGEVNDARMFGPSYRLTTEISLVPGSTAFRIEDEVTNVGGIPAEFELLYHCNYGPPLLGEGSRLVAPVKRMSARDEVALDGLDNWDRFEGPRAGFVEQCFFFTLHSDDDHRTSVALVDPEQQLAARLSYSVNRLPAFTLWKNTASEADGYVTGLEPATDYPNPRQFEREQGRVISLQPGHSYNAGLKMEFIEESSLIRQATTEIEDLVEGAPSVHPSIDPALSPQS